MARGFSACARMMSSTNSASPRPSTPARWSVAIFSPSSNTRALARRYRGSLSRILGRCRVTSTLSMYCVAVRTSWTYSGLAAPVRISPSWSVTMYCIARTTGTRVPGAQSRPIARSVIATRSFSLPLSASREYPRRMISRSSLCGAPSSPVMLRVAPYSSIRPCQNSLERRLSRPSWEPRKSAASAPAMTG
jgi:hypothetical protein